MTFRIENKYNLDIHKKNLFYKFLNNNNATKIYPDRNIKSIYFDNNQLQSYHDSIEGTVPRKKIRLRNYTKKIDNDLNMNLEIKINSIEGRFKRNIENMNTKKLLQKGYHDRTYGICKPLLIIMYKREYYNVHNYRLTLDNNIQYCDYNLNNNNIIKDNRTVFELKTLDFSNMNKIDELFPFEKIRFSKYCYAVEKILKFNNF